MRKHVFARSLAAATVALAFGCAPVAAPQIQAPIDPALRDELGGLSDEALGDRPLIVSFATERFDEGGLVKAFDLERDVARFARDAEVDVDAEVRADIVGFEAVPYAVIHVDHAGLDGVLASRNVTGVFDDAVYSFDLTQSLPFINQPAAVAAGATGAGTAVAVLDTGLDYTRAAFGSCANAAALGTAGCRVKAALDFAPDDGALDDNGHGTNVAGIVGGVAPDAKLIGLDVFQGAQGFSSHILAAIDWVVAHRAEHNIVAINMSLGSGGSTTACTNDVFAAALDTLRGNGVVPVVASGNNGFTDRISSPACVPAALSVGAVYDTSRAGGVSYSSCTDASIVADKPTCFSNTAPFLNIMAPGFDITAAGISMSGTSQATPHVAGAVAVVASAFPNDTVSARVARLTGAGRAITDPRTSRSFPRLDVGAAVATAPCQTSVSLSPSSLDFAGGTTTATVNTAAGCAWSLSSSAPWLTLASTSGTGPSTVTVTAARSDGRARSASISTSTGASAAFSQTADTTAPTGTLTVDGVTPPINTKAVTLALNATDNAAVTQMCISNTTTCTAFEAYATRKSFTLAPSGNTATVRAWFKDANGNTSAVTSTSVAYDATAPTGGTVTATAGDANVRLQWSGFTDAVAVASTVVVVATGTAAPANCSGTALTRGTATSFTHSALTNGTSYSYRVCAVDTAGNVSTGVVVTAKPVPETTAPTGSVVIAGGDVVHSSSAVTLTLNASDATGVASMCISNTATCTTFAAYATTKAWTLASGSGARTVNVWFRDTWGNTSAAPVSATTTVDTVVPADGTATVTARDGALALTWTGFSDANSGLAGTRLAYAPTTAPANCTTGTLVNVAGTSTTTQTISGLSNGTVYGVRVCGVDVAGNVSRGVAVTSRPAPEFAAPTATSVLIAAGATLVKSVAVELTVSATDTTGVTEMCVSNAATCTAWKPYATTSTWTLTSGSGLRTVSVWFRDRWMNTTTTPATDTIDLDTTRPTGGAVTATAQSRAVTLSWSGFTDANSGVASYVVVSGPSAPGNCTLGTVVYSGTALTMTHGDLVAGTRVGYRVCAVDVAGNLALGVTTTATPTP